MPAPPTASRLEAELREQAAVLRARTEAGSEHAAAAAARLGADDVDFLVIAARGSSDNAARYAQYLLGREARLVVGLAAPSLFAGGRPPLLTRGAVLGISQSGRSPDIVAVLAAARDQGRPSVAITNDPSSPLAAAADVVVPLDAGEELSVAATKTYLASLHAVAQLAALLGDGLSECDLLADRVDAAVDDALARRARFDALAAMGSLTVVGRGLQLATACETALKVRELSGLSAEAFSPPDLLHGPIAAIGETVAAWAIESAPPRGAGLTVAVSADPERVAAADIGVALPPGLPAWQAPFLAVIPGQAAALRLGELAGVELDRPHGLHKVTLTR